MTARRGKSPRSKDAPTPIRAARRPAADARVLDLRAALESPLETTGLLEIVPELSLARELEGSPYHHLDTLDHVLEVVRGVEHELEEGRVGARVRQDRVHGLRLAALLHDVAKPVTRGELEG